MQLTGAVDDIVAAHRQLVGPRHDGEPIDGVAAVVRARHTDRQSTLVVRTDGPVTDPAWTVHELSLEDLILAYLRERRRAGQPRGVGSGGMIWLTWRQHRKQAMYTVIGLAALAAFIVPTGLAMHRDFDRLVVRGCAANTLDMPCDGFHDFSTTYGSYIYACVLLLIVPLLFGLFWGAPLIAREIEQGTHRMIWTQGISRRHWALAKVGLLSGAVTVLAVVYGLGISWWYEPLGYVESRFGGIFFDVQGVAPVGYTLFAVALGIAAGALVPKVVPAMAITLPIFIAARIAVALYARPRFATPVSKDFPVVGGPCLRERRHARRRLAAELGRAPAGRHVRRLRRHGLPARGSHRMPRSVQLRPAQPPGVPAGGTVLDVPVARDRHLRRPCRAAGLVRGPPHPPDHLTPGRRVAADRGRARASGSRR